MLVGVGGEWVSSNVDGVVVATARVGYGEDEVTRDG